MPVRLLEPVLVDRIAAGEVVDRPASAVKELVENALDAGASDVRVALGSGGRRLIRVVDDGEGMSPEDLTLAVERHATSKLPDDDLLGVRTMGFRGEALPSIGSVSVMTVTTRRAGDPVASRLVVDNGLKSPVGPAAGTVGTRVEVTDLFSAVPARLKFLRGDKAEVAAVAEVLRRLAVARPEVRFVLESDGGTVFDMQARTPDAAGFLARFAQVVGNDVVDNHVPVHGERSGTVLTGVAGLPSHHRATQAHVHLVVDGRVVRDKLLSGALRGAYADTIVRGRHPVVGLMLRCTSGSVDVNVHPAKTEVRFRDPEAVKGLVVSTVREALGRAGARSTTHTTGHAVSSFMPMSVGPPDPVRHRAPSTVAPTFAGDLSVPSADARGDAGPSARDDHPLGAAKAQILENYIVAQSSDGMVIVDGHAAHERLVYERMKAQRASGGVATQILLVPCVVDLDPGSAEALTAAAGDLSGVGLVVEPFGPGSVVVREVPSALASTDLPGLVREVADGLLERGDLTGLTERLDAVLASMACHGSVRSGRRLVAAEMDSLLREMERTPNSGTCLHGRPVVTRLSAVDMERLFGRR